ncbi:MAG: lipoate--protein ligase family protein [Actinobacteria bacterium]|nr:lipoate--protein ligase family protein [Actinomycetota bacterium]
MPTAVGVTWRLIDDVGCGPADHMQRDLAMLDDVLAGAPPALRVYTWSVPTLSLGKFQSIDEIDNDACERLGVALARRPTGGAALLHGGDLTYSVAMPLPEDGHTGVQEIYDWLARALIAGLARLGVDSAVARHDGPGGPVCFAGQQGADLRVGDRKVCGSAQVRRQGAVLQHGSILLRRLAIDECDLVMTPYDKQALRAATITLDELGAPCEASVVADAIVTGFMTALGVAFTPTTLVAAKDSRDALM